MSEHSCVRSPSLPKRHNSKTPHPSTSVGSRGDAMDATPSLLLLAGEGRQCSPNPDVSDMHTK